MFRSFLLLFLFFLPFAGCKEENPLPLEEEKLINVLTDIHLAEAALKTLTGTTKDTTAIRLYNQIYTMHEVSETEVDSCLSYLKKHPDEMQKLMDEVLEKMGIMKIEKK